MTTSEKCQNPWCKNGTDFNVHNPEVYLRPCLNCSAPPVSSVPGEAGPYTMVSPIDEDLLTARDLNLAYAQGRASMKAEMEVAREGLRNAKVAMTCAGNSREPYDIGRYLRDGLVAVDAALTPSKEAK